VVVRRSAVALLSQHAANRLLFVASQLQLLAASRLLFAANQLQPLVVNQLRLADVAHQLHADVLAELSLTVRTAKSFTKAKSSSAKKSSANLSLANQFLLLKHLLNKQTLISLEHCSLT